MMNQALSHDEMYEFFLVRIPEYQRDITLFCREVLCFEPDEWQQDVFEDLSGFGPVSIAVKSGQGVGKTGVEAASALWFLACFPYSRVVATAPTRQQLHDVLWAEIAKWQSKSPLLQEILKWTKTYVYMSGCDKRWFAVARTATKPENMQGFHEENMLFIVDEASGVTDPILEAIRGTLTGENNKLLYCGNPTKGVGGFYDAFHKDRTLFCCHTVNSEDSPRTNKINIRAMERKYGRNSNVYRVRVLGEFPMQDDDVFIQLSDLEASCRTESQTFGVDENGQEVAVQPIISIDIGADIARYGSDNTCIGYKVNEVFRFHKKYQGKSTVWTANTIAQLYLQLKEKYSFQGTVPIKVDDGGVGGGVVDMLMSMKKNDTKFADMLIKPVNFGVRIKHKYYYDSTTYMMGVVRSLVGTLDDAGKEKPCELIIPNDDELIAQLSTRKYDFRSDGKVYVESKEQFKENHDGKSPDEADCLLLTCLPIRVKK